MSALSPEDRIRYVGASEVGAVIGINPYKSRYALWMEKAGKVPVEDLSGRIPVLVGQALEETVAQKWAADNGVQITRPDGYLVHPECERTGASLDFIGANGGKPLAVEIKTVGESAFQRWEDGRPPFSYICQVEHQLACAQIDEGVLVVLVGNREIRDFPVPAHPPMQKHILGEVQDFWKSVDADEPPDPDFRADQATLNRIVLPEQGKEVEVDDTELAGDIDRMARLREIVQEQTREISGIQGRLRHYAERHGATVLTSPYADVGFSRVAAQEIKAHTRAAYTRMNFRRKR